MKKPKSKSDKRDKKAEVRVRCQDCGRKYAAGAPHQMFCPVKMCSTCGTTYQYIIEPNADGDRICEKCQESDNEQD